MAYFGLLQSRTPKRRHSKPKPSMKSRIVINATKRSKSVRMKHKRILTQIESPVLVSGCCFILNTFNGLTRLMMTYAGSWPIRVAASRYLPNHSLTMTFHILINILCATSLARMTKSKTTWRRRCAPSSIKDDNGALLRADIEART
jgi:hypothetical protein